MKTPLRFQATEYDCGTTSFINALSYLFKRKEIPAELIKKINLYTLDEFDANGTEGEGGTSRYAMAILVHWLNSYAEAKGLDLMCERLEGENVTLDEMKNCISKNGVAISRLFQECDHYALVTDIDDNFVYLFDPYYLDKTYYDEDEQVKIVFDKPFNFNRKVSIERFLSEGHKDFALGEIAHRECVLMKRTNGM